MSLYKERELGHAAEQILSSDVWKEAWSAYRARILEEIEGARSNDTDTVMHLKRLLAAASAAKSHMERLMNEGAAAAKSIEFQEKQSKLKRVFG